MTGYGITDRGKIRGENQDTYRLLILQDENLAVLVVCDGMGGASAGALASEIACNEFFTYVENALVEGETDFGAIMLKGVESANSAVYSQSLFSPETRGMGTTLVAAIVRGDECVIANVGDSRAYLIGNGSIMRVTRDHSLVEDMVALGELTRDQARTHPKKNLITRALGIDSSVKCDIFEASLGDGDMILLCSDGLSNMIRDEEILKAVKSSKPPEDLCKKLLKTTLRRGAPDNVTIVAVKR